MRKVTIEIDLDEILKEDNLHVRTRLPLEYWDIVFKHVCFEDLIHVLTDREAYFLYGPRDYNYYLTTDTWKKRREYVIEQAGHKCYICGCSENLQVHHINYDYLFNEHFGDLECLCKPCHEKLHKVLSAINELEVDTISERMIAVMFFNVFHPSDVIPGHLPHMASVILDHFKRFDERFSAIKRPSILPKELAARRRELLQNKKIKRLCQER